MSFLNIDRSEFKKSFLINNKEDEGPSADNVIENYINNKHKVPTMIVTPIPGFCVKTRTKNGDKVFINICHVPDLPAPKGPRIPMSIGYEREICDKSGNPCIAFDVAVNSVFFGNKDFRNEMFIGTIIEAVADKHELELDNQQFHILKNLKSKGKIQPMEIEKRPVQEETIKRPLISEIDEKKITKQKEIKSTVPEFNLIKVDSTKPYYGSEIDLKNVLSEEEISLQLGEDRLFLTTNGKMKYELEYHFPEYINVDLSKAEFDEESQILTVVAPLCG